MATANIKAVITAEDRASDVVGKFGTKSVAALGAIAGIASSLTTKAIDLLSQAISGAVKRVDILNNSSRVFANMGFGADEVTSSMNLLKDSILGLPTPLDEAVSGMQMIASSTGDIGLAQKVFSALNNAVIGFGGSTQDVTRSTLQLSQAFSNGKIDAQTWNSLMQNNLGPTLNAIAKKMGITTGQLKEGLSDGSISVNEFQKQLVDLDKNGGGGLKSLQTIAKDATAGIGTGMENAKTAIVRGVAKIIEAFGSENISKTISKAGDLVEKAFAKVADGIKDLQPLLPWLAAAVGGVLVVAFTALGVSIWSALAPLLPFIALGVAIGVGIKLLVDAFGGLDNIMKMLQPTLQLVGNIFNQYIKPALEDLWNTIQTQLLPVLQEFWDKNQNWIIPALQALAIVIGVVILGSIMIFIGILKMAVQAISWLGQGFTWVVEQIKIGVGWIRERIDYMKNHFWESIGYIIGFFASLPAKILFYIGSAISGAVNYIMAIDWWGVLKGLWNAWSRLEGFVRTAIGNMINAAIHADWYKIGASIANAIIGMMEGAINGAISGIPGMKGVKLPRFAKGVENFSGGLAVVGERGPELVNLPRGSDVIPNNKLGGSTGGGSTTININVGLMTGSAIERREAAMKMFEDLQDIASQRGQSVGQLIGV